MILHMSSWTEADCEPSTRSDMTCRDTSPEIIRSLPWRSVRITRPRRIYVYVAHLDVPGATYPLFFHLRREWRAA